jgi:ornithine cyclodeaminase
MNVRMIGPEAEAHLDWIALSDALAEGHALPRAEIADAFLTRGGDTLLNRAAWIDGLGLLVKSATVFPDNADHGIPAVNGGVSLYDDATGQLEAVLDFHLVTKWKTAADSLLAARRLARPDARAILIVGAGQVAASMIAAYRAAFADADVTIWNRRPAGATRLATATGAQVADDLAEAVSRADIIATATMSAEPLIRGDWLRPGQHLDLIGAFRADMREADDEALARARLFVDSRATTLHHIGEIKDPVERGVIAAGDIVADFYDLPRGTFARNADDEITLCKNGGGAHLDLMTARYILGALPPAG